MKCIGKLISCAIIVAGGLLTASHSIEAETIKIGFFEHKPHQFKTETAQKTRGATIVYFDMVADKMGYDVEWVGPLPMFRLVQYLKDGTVDGTAHLVKIPDLDEFVYYADQPFHYAQPIFVVRKENPLEKITTIEDVKGYQVGWLGEVDKFLPSPFVIEHLKQLHIQPILGTKMWEQQLKKLLAGRLDAVHDLNSYTLMYEAKRLHIERKVKALPLPEPSMPVLVLFSRQSSKGAVLTTQYNKVSAEIKFTPEDYYQLVDEEFDSLPIRD